MFGPNFRDFVSQDAPSQGQSNSERLIKSWHGFEKPNSEDSGDSGIEEEFEVLDGESQEIPANSCDTLPEDLSLENEILANFPDGCDRSLTVESKDEGSFDIIPKSLTFAEITNILNQAIQEDNCEELDEVVQNIEDYEGRSITLDNVNLKSFCEQQLNLDLQDRSDHQHIYSNVLSQYKFDQENFECDYSVKELVLLAIAANDKLTERYQDILFAEGNLSLLPLLVGGQKYIEAFIEKFHGTDGVYGRLKGQAIQLVEPNKIDFFSVIALRKEQELLNAVFVEYVLRDFGQVLKTSKPDPLYGVLETASLIKNEEFITIVLGAFERYINEPTKKASTEELLKKSFATLLETAISQERISVIEYLCKRYTNSADHAIYDVYEQAFADDKVITILRQQILKNIGARGRKKIYDLILKTALDAGNIAFIEHLCKECAECSNDVIGYLNQKFKNNEFDNIHESILIALSNVEYTNTDVIVEVLFYTKEIHQNVSHEQVVRQAIRNILRNATHYSIGQEDYSLVKGVCYLCTEIDAINIIFQEEYKIFKSSIEKRIEDLEKENKLLQSEALREYNSRLPGIVNGLVQTACIVYDEYTKDPKDNKRQENTDLILSLMQIRNILQFSIDVQEYPCHERQDLWDEMYQAPGTFTMRKRSHNVADELEIPVITSDILSENPGLESAGSQQPQENVNRRENIMNNEEASIEEAIGNDCEEGKMHSSDQNTKSIEEMLCDAVSSINLADMMDLLRKVDDSVYKSTLQKCLDQANDKITSLEEGEQKETLREMIVFLKKELEHIAAVSSVGNDVKITASSQEVPVVEPEGSESDLASSSSEDGDYSRLESGKSAGTSSDSDFPFEEVPSIATKEAKVNDEQSDNINGDDLTPVSSPVSGDVLTSRSDEEEPVVITTRQPNDSEHDKTVSKEHQDDALEKDLIDFSSDDGNSLLGDPVPTSTNKISEQEDGTQTTTRQQEVFPFYRYMQNGRVLPSGSLNPITEMGNTQNLQVAALGSQQLAFPNVIEISNKHDREGFTLLTLKLMVQEFLNNGISEIELPSSTGPITLNLDEIIKASTEQLQIIVKALTDLYKNGTLNSRTINAIGTGEDVPVPTPEPVPPVANNKSEQVNNTQTNGGQPNDSGKNNAIPQNTKSSKLPVIAASALAIAGVAAGIAIAVYLEMLAVGVVVGACCLVAAAVIYCCTPKSSVESKNVTKLTGDEFAAQQTVN